MLGIGDFACGDQLIPLDRSIFAMQSIAVIKQFFFNKKCKGGNLRPLHSCNRKFPGVTRSVQPPEALPQDVSEVRRQ